MLKYKQSMILIFIAVLIIPLAHWILPMLYSSAPSYVSTGQGSIMGQGHNIYLQLLPYVVAYLLAPILLIKGIILLKKQRKLFNSNNTK